MKIVETSSDTRIGLVKCYSLKMIDNILDGGGDIIVQNEQHLISCLFWSLISTTIATWAQAFIICINVLGKTPVD